MQASQKAIDLIKQFEGFRSKPYLCPAGVPTIGYGSTFYENGTKVTMQDDCIDQEEATDILKAHVDKIVGNLAARIVSLGLNQNQIDALVSWVYNLGIGNFDKSTLYKKLKLKQFKEAGLEILVWNKSQGKTLEGLVKRRQAEFNLFNRL